MSRRRGQHLTPEQHAQLIEEITVSKGVYPTAMAQKHGVSRRYVWALCHQYGTPMTKRISGGRINLILSGVDREEIQRRRELQERAIQGDSGALQTFSRMYHMTPLVLRGQVIEVTA